MKLKRIPALLLSVVLVFLLATTAYAHDVPDMDRLCSITITMRNGRQSVPGGSLTIYRVGDIVEDDGNYSFAPTRTFARAGVSFEDLEKPYLADRLWDFAQERSIPGMQTKAINDAGRVTFRDLPVGLYLVVQTEPAPGYSAIAPFLVSLPYFEDGEYVYDLKAEPKTELWQEPETIKPTVPDSKIPQTGQLWWPVPMLFCGGLAMVVLGFAINRRKRTDEIDLDR